MATDVPWGYALIAVLMATSIAAGEAGMKVPTGFHATEGTKSESYSGTGYALEVVHGKTGMEMVFVPAGTFRMGSPDSEEGRQADEGAMRTVRITRPFYMGKYEVTQEEWAKVMDEDRMDKFDFHKSDRFKGERHPVVGRISWDDCQAFMRKAGDGLRLPTEAEWEYACRAGTRTAYSFGGGPAKLAEHAWYAGNAEGKTHPVGEKLPNAWGLYDMHGSLF